MEEKVSPKQVNNAHSPPWSNTTLIGLVREVPGLFFWGAALRERRNPRAAGSQRLLQKPISSSNHATTGNTIHALLPILRQSQRDFRYPRLCGCLRSDSDLSCPRIMSVAAMRRSTPPTATSHVRPVAYKTTSDRAAAMRTGIATQLLASIFSMEPYTA